MTVFQNRGHGQKEASRSARRIRARSFPSISPKSAANCIAQKDSFLCAAKGVSVGIAFNKKIGAGLFGGEGFIMQRLQGDGWAFVHAGGTISRTRARARAKCCAWIPAASSRFSRRVDLRHPISSAKSNPRSSAAKVCSSPRCAGRDKSGCNRCR